MFKFHLTDAAYELAKAVSSPSLGQYQPKLFNESLLCPYQDESCAISLRKSDYQSISLEDKTKLLQVSVKSFNDVLKKKGIRIKFKKYCL
jgi:hypothetical protein